MNPDPPVLDPPHAEYIQSVPRSMILILIVTLVLFSTLRCHADKFVIVNAITAVTNVFFVHYSKKKIILYLLKVLDVKSKAPYVHCLDA